MMKAGEDEVYAAATDTTKAFAEKASATIPVLLRWLSLYLIDLKFEESEDYSKEATEARTTNM